MAILLFMKTSFKLDRGSPKYLSDLQPGESCVIVEVDPHSPVSRRLLDLGLLPNTPVSALRRAPMGDPTVFELRGYGLGLREQEASRIRIKAAAVESTES